MIGLWTTAFTGAGKAFSDVSFGGVAGGAGGSDTTIKGGAIGAMSPVAARTGASGTATVSRGPPPGAYSNAVGGSVGDDVCAIAAPFAQAALSAIKIGTDLDMRICPPRESRRDGADVAD